MPTIEHDDPRDTLIEDCTMCEGTGVIGAGRRQRECPDCQGSGEVILNRPARVLMAPTIECWDEPVYVRVAAVPWHAPTGEVLILPLYDLGPISDPETRDEMLDDRLCPACKDWHFPQVFAELRHGDQLFDVAGCASGPLADGQKVIWYFGVV